MSTSRPAILALEDGTVFRGVSVGAEGETFGEVVFQTALTGYQEVLTDPSYAGQIVVMTAPEMGNVGANPEDEEARGKPACAGFVMRQESPVVSSWRAAEPLGQYLARHGIVSIGDIDTRALTRRLRTVGAQRGAISTVTLDGPTLVDKVKKSPSMEGLNLVDGVTCKTRYTWDQPSWVAPDLRASGVRAPGVKAVPPADLHVVAYDYGIKLNILRSLRDLGCRVTVLPAQTPAAEALALGADGYFLSNGPGDPAAVTYAAPTARALVDSGKPVFGICLGHQILGLALGGKTYKLRFGHHGANHPVKDLATGKVEITSQNHGFCVDVDSLKGKATLTHINLNDQTVEGMKLDDRPVFSVQYHPEASPGPHDAEYLFGRFVKLMRAAK